MATSPRKPASMHNHGLYNGDRMTQAEFHRVYETTPKEYKAELIGGVVHEPSPLGWPHGKSDAQLGHLLTHYAVLTEGVESAHSPTIILGEEDEVQPDIVLRVNPQRGGRTKDTNDKTPYVLGAPELVAEVAHSSRAIDLHLKKDRYALARVPEYIVVCLEPAKLYWFDLSTQEELAPTDDIWKSRIFPGLWIHGEGLLANDYRLCLEVLSQGMETPEYQVFSSNLKTRK